MEDSAKFGLVDPVEEQRAKKRRLHADQAELLDQLTPCGGRSRLLALDVSRACAVPQAGPLVLVMTAALEQPSPWRVHHAMDRPVDQGRIGVTLGPRAVLEQAVVLVDHGEEL
jgi:hypothetical protein